MALNIKLIVSMLFGLFFSALATLKLVADFFREGPKVFRGPKYRRRPQILTDPKYGKSGFLHLKGITLHYMEKGDRQKPLCLLVHGFPEFWFSWRHQITSELADKFHLVAIDMRGYNESDKPQAVDDYKMSVLVEDMRQAIRALGHQSCYLVGHDWGGAVCWSFASAHPAMVVKFAALNIPHPGAFTKELNSSWRQFKKSWYMMLFQLPMFPEWYASRCDLRWIEQALTSKEAGVKPGMIDSSELDAFKYTFGQPKALTGPINYYRAAFRNMQHQLQHPKLPMPILLIFGVNDVAITVEAAKYSAKFCSNFDLQLVDNASHWVQQDEPQLVNKLLLEFLQ